MNALIALAIAAAAVPQPAELRTFKDWIVGCDNGRACQAVALMPEDGQWEERVTLALRRGAESEAVPEIGFDGDVAIAALAAGGKRLPVAIVGTKEQPVVRPDTISALLQAIRTEQALETLDGKGKRTGRISLSGASAALLYMDEQQHRLNTVTALVRTGAKPASAVPSPPPLPMLVSAPLPAGAKSAEIPASEVKRLARNTGCDARQPEGMSAEVEASAIDARTTLILLSCGGGAYNLYSVPFVARRQGTKLRIEAAPFDARPGSPEEKHPSLVNAGWDAARRRLVAFAKGRGIGDCGVGDEYIWDGARFRLAEQIAMGECRGSVDYITTWRARVQ